MSYRRAVWLATLLVGCKFDTSGVGRPPDQRTITVVTDGPQQLPHPGDRCTSELCSLLPDLQQQREQPPDYRPFTDALPCATWQEIKCNDVCVNVWTDKQNCGDCGNVCEGNKVCCNGGCTDTNTDHENCGACGHQCASIQACKAKTYPSEPCRSPCKYGNSLIQAFSTNMWGCSGKTLFNNRSDLCNADFHVCKASEWLKWYSNIVPEHHYWTDDFLYADMANAGDGNCAVTTNKKLWPAYWCDGGPPMRVCKPNGSTDSNGRHLDPEGNICNWVSCGYESHTNQYFGGCNGNDYAGTLCCLNP